MKILKLTRKSSGEPFTIIPGPGFVVEPDVSGAIVYFDQDPTNENRWEVLETFAMVTQQLEAL